MLGANPNDNHTPMAWTSQANGRSPDWVFSEASSAHLTNDRSWFENDFVEFDSQISNSRASIANIPVRGVGTVILPVKQRLAGQGSAHGASMRLENVLYVPDYPCNVVGSPIRALASIQFSSLTPRGAMVYGDGAIAALFMPGRDYYQIMLREDPLAMPLGRSVLDEHPEYGMMLAFSWSELEQQRWRNLQFSLRTPQRLGNACANEMRFPMNTGFNTSAKSSINYTCPSSPNQMDVDTTRSRKRGAEDEMECSPRRAKRSRAMASFQPRRILSAVFSRG